jgi:hypothetical protein
MKNELKKASSLFRIFWTQIYNFHSHGLSMDQINGARLSSSGEGAQSAYTRATQIMVNTTEQQEK